MRAKTETLLQFMLVLSWISFIGLLVKCGAVLFLYVFSLFNADSTRSFYLGVNLYELYQYSFWQLSLFTSWMVILAGLQAYIAYLVINVLSKIKLVNPFQMEIAQQLEKIAYYIFGSWIITVFSNAHTKWLMKRFDGMEDNLLGTEFIFLAGVVFIFSQVFKKGVEIQSENELTV